MTPAVGKAPETNRNDPRATFKPREVDEPVDYYVNRPLASRLVSLFARTSITPNQVTALSGAVGAAAGIVIALAPLGPSIEVPLGGLLLFVSLLLDCADGQLARLRGQSSMMGRALDGYVDVLPTAAVFVGYAWYLYRAGYDPFFINGLGWPAGYSLKWHAHSYDHAKNIFLHNTLPRDQRGQSLPTAEEIEAEWQRHRERGEWFSALVVKGFARVTASQRRGFQKERIGLGLRGTETDRERLLYRLAFQGTMRIWSWNGLAFHLYLFLFATLATPFYAGAVLVAWWIMVLPMNFVVVYVLAKEKRVERSLQASFRAASPENLAPNAA